MPFTTIITTLREPLSTIHAIYNKPSTPQCGSFRNCFRYNMPAHQRLINFIKSYNWAHTATYTKLSTKIGLYTSNFIIRQLLKKEGFW